MVFPFQRMILEAPGFYELINTWAEMQLVVEADSARIIGDGYTHEMLKACEWLVENIGTGTTVWPAIQIKRWG